jgi:PAS domain S-box-containing protein
VRKPGLAFGHPVFDERGQLARVLYAVLDLSVPNAEAAKTRPPKGGVLNIFDRAGNILAHYPEPEQWIGKSLPKSPDVATVLTKLEGTAEMRGLDEVSRLYAFTAIRNGNDANLFVSVGIPTTLAFAEIRHALVRDLTVLAVVAGLTLIAAWLYADWYVLNPVKTLTGTMKQVASGDLSARTRIVRASAELSQLSRTFDDMAGQLQRQSTETERSERALRENEERVRLILDTALDGVITLDERGTITSWNKEAERTFGWKQAEILGQGLTATIIPPRFREAHERGLQRFMATHEGAVLNERIEFTGLRRDGGEIPVEMAITPIRLGERFIFSAFVRDISARKQAEMGLAHLAAIVESSADSIVGKTLDGRIVSWNQGAERIYGYAAHEVKGRSIGILIPAERAGELPTLLERVGRGERIENYETVRVAKDGRRIPVSLTLSPIKDAAGKITGVSTISRDITELKRTEAQIAASLKEKEVLLKEIHHRVKNNLQFVSSLLNLQSNVLQDERLLAILRESRDRVRTMALIHEKLYQSSDLARIEFKQHIHDLALMVFRSYSPGSNAIKLDVQVEAVSLAIETAVPLSFILNEIISNCLKHAFPDGREGRITIQFLQDAHGRFHLVVADNGVGLPPDFSLADSTSLGLRLVQILTDQLSGKLTYRSNGGAQFEVTFDVQHHSERG